MVMRLVLKCGSSITPFHMPLPELHQLVKGVRAIGMEVCITLGMLSPDQAKQLKEA